MTSYFGSKKTLRRLSADGKSRQPEPAVSRERKLAHCGNKQTNKYRRSVGRAYSPVTAWFST